MTYRLILANKIYAFNFECNFQPSHSAILDGISSLHHDIMTYLLLVIVGLTYLLMRLCFLLDWTSGRESFLNYAIGRQTNIHVFTDCKRYMDLDSIIEWLWTIIPLLMLLLIGTISIAFIYSISNEVYIPTNTIGVTGHQWYWSYNFFISMGDSAVDPLKKETIRSFFKNILEVDLGPTADLVPMERFGIYEEDSSLNFMHSSRRVEFDSYLVPEEYLSVGELRLLEVDNRLVVPAQAHIRVLVTSDDVIHSWSIPSVGIKVDAIPGRINHCHLFLKRPGIFYGQCSELCGIGHAYMPIVIQAIPDYLFKYVFLSDSFNVSTRDIIFCD